jgi:hypothetical protein
MTPPRHGHVEIMLRLTPEAVEAMRRTVAEGVDAADAADAADGELPEAVLDDGDLACARVRVPVGRAEALASRLAASPGVAAAYVFPLS